MLHSKKNILILSATFCVLAFLIVFSVYNWQTIEFLFTNLTMSVEVLKDYVLSLGTVGIICMSIVIIVCFFFPVISSTPIQVVSGISYGLPLGTLHVLASVFIASQILFLLTRSFRVFSTKKQIQEREEIERKIKNSRISILYFVVLAYLAPFIPFLIIHSVALNSGMKWWKYSLITLIGPLGDVIITLWAGVKITTSSSPIVSYVILVLIVVIVILSTIYKNKMVDFIFKPKKEKENGEQKRNSD